MWKNLFRSKSKSKKNTDSTALDAQLALCKLCDKCDKCFLDLHLIEQKYICQKCYTKQYTDIPSIEPPTDEFIELHPCPVCSRNFNIKTYAKHVTVCEKIATKKRKAFDSSRQRREGTDYANYVPMKRESLNTTSFIKLSHQSLPSVVQQINKGKFSSPKTTTKLRTPTMSRRESKELPRRVTKSSFTQQPTEQCPYCGRCFGNKAYDRHVEWCREKSLLGKNSNNNSGNVSVAKERLNARIKYKAPSLKSKRALNREKYSGSMSCGVSSTSLNEILSTSSSRYKLPDSSSLNKSGYNSMNSSFYSESGVSVTDKYDPFMSAKQQLEELFSTTPATENTSTPIKLEKSPSPNRYLPSQASNISNRRPSVESIQSNSSSFRRTSSLRLPKAKAKPYTLSSPVPNIKSNIQCGLSDDNPISPNFVKSSEYDEIPIKAAYNVYSVTTNNNYIKPSMLDMIYNKKKNEKIDTKPASPSVEEYPSTKTDTLSLYTKFKNDYLKNPVISEKEMKDKSNKMINKKILQTNETNNKFPEINLNNISSNLSNIKLEPLNAKTSRKKTSLLTLDSILNNNNNINYNSNHFTNAFNNNNNNKSNDSSILEKCDENFIDPQLINACDNLPVNVKQFTGPAEINPEKKTIKSPVNLEFNPRDMKNVSSNSTETSSSSPLSNINNNIKHIPSPLNRNTLRRRQVKLSKDNILFDTSPEEDTNTLAELSDRRTSKSNSNTRTSDDVESLFDDFDFDEFISSFEDDEQYPIFKEYKNILLSRAINQTKNLNIYDSNTESTNNINPNNNENDKVNSTENSFNQRSDIDRDAMYLSTKEKSFTIDRPTKNDKVVSICDNKEGNGKNSNNNINFNNTNDTDNPTKDADEIEKEYLKSVNELEDICFGNKSRKLTTIGSSFPNDSDELSSMDDYSDRRTIKLSADSAYGSLSRNSPSERMNSRSHPSRGRHENPSPWEGKASSKPMPAASSTPTTSHNNNNVNPKSRPYKLRENASLSSSGSETSLPALSTNVVRLQKSDPNVGKEKPLGNVETNKLSRFCYQCGNRFHTQAKFCMECGVKRMSLD